MTFFYRAAALADINRFISLWRLDHGPFSFLRPQKIAFFPGTFDPFTLSHKGIVHAIRDLGFEVYLAVDEFSGPRRPSPTWSAGRSSTCPSPGTSTCTCSPTRSR